MKNKFLAEGQKMLRDKVKPAVNQMSPSASSAASATSPKANQEMLYNSSDSSIPSATEKDKKYWRHRQGQRPAKLTPKIIVEEFQEFLRTNQCFGGPATDGHFKTNFISFMLTEHEVFSIFTTHPLDRFDRKWRLWFYITVCAFWQMGWSRIYESILPQGSPFIIILTALMVEPAKYFARQGIECPCVWSNSFYYRICCIWMRLLNVCKVFFSKIGRFFAGFFTFICLAIGLILTLSIKVEGSSTADSYFWTNWLISIVAASFVVTPISIAISVMLKYKKHKVRFQEKWGAYFPKDDPPISYTSLALIARENGFAPDEKVWEEKWDSYFISPPCSAYFTKTSAIKVAPVPVLTSEPTPESAFASAQTDIEVGTRAAVRMMLTQHHEDNLNNP